MAVKTPTYKFVFKNLKTLIVTKCKYEFKMAETLL